MSQRVGSGLAGANGQQSLQDIQAEFAFAQTTMTDAKERQTERKMMLEDLLQGIEQAPQEEVAAQILALQTRLQASLQTTAMLYQLSIVSTPVTSDLSYTRTYIAVARRRAATRLEGWPSAPLSLRAMVRDAQLRGAPHHEGR